MQFTWKQSECFFFQLLLLTKYIRCWFLSQSILADAIYQLHELCIKHNRKLQNCKNKLHFLLFFYLLSNKIAYEIIVESSLNVRRKQTVQNSQRVRRALEYLFPIDSSAHDTLIRYLYSSCSICSNCLTFKSIENSIFSFHFRNKRQHRHQHQHSPQNNYDSSQATAQSNSHNSYFTPQGNGGSNFANAGAQGMWLLCHRTWFNFHWKLRERELFSSILE